MDPKDGGRERFLFLLWARWRTLYGGPPVIAIEPIVPARRNEIAISPNPIVEKIKNVGITFPDGKSLPSNQELCSLEWLSKRALILNYVKVGLGEGRHNAVGITIRNFLKSLRVIIEQPVFCLRGTSKNSPFSGVVDLESG